MFNAPIPLNIRCDWCGEMNKVTGTLFFDCQFCQKPNKVVAVFESRKDLDRGIEAIVVFFYWIVAFPIICVVELIGRLFSDE